MQIVQEELKALDVVKCMDTHDRHGCFIDRDQSYVIEFVHQERALIRREDKKKYRGNSVWLVDLNRMYKGVDIHV